MSLRAAKHIFTGETTSIDEYDASRTNLGSLMFQNSGLNPEDNFAGPLSVGIARPMQEIVDNIGTVEVTTTTVTGAGTNFITNLVGMAIGFGSIDPAQITTWYTISSFSSATNISITPSIGATPIDAGTSYVVVANKSLLYPHAITYSDTIDLVFLIENSTASIRGIFMYEYDKTISEYIWKGFIRFNITLANPTIQGFKVFRYLHNRGTVQVSGTSVTGVNTKWIEERIAVGARIGFGSSDPLEIVSWFVISNINNDSSITLDSSAGVIVSGTAYVIEELRFGFTTTDTTATRGGLFVIKGINYSDFTFEGSELIQFQNGGDNQKALYWLSDAGSTANIATNTAACGLAIQDEINKGLHYVYVLNGVSSTFMTCYRYNIRATGTVNAAKMLLSISPYATGTVEVSNTIVTGTGTTFTSGMTGMRIGFETTSPAAVNTWYTISEVISAMSIILIESAGSISAGTFFIIDSADVVVTGNQLVTGSPGVSNNGRIGTLRHGPGKDHESLYFVTTTHIYRADISDIFSGNLAWISDNRPEIPPGSVSTFTISNSLNNVEIADSIDRLIVSTSGSASFRHYVTKFSDSTGDPFDHIWGIDDKQQDQISVGSDIYVSSGTVEVSGTVVTGTGTFFTSSMIGFRIGFGSTDPENIVTWYMIVANSSFLSIGLSVGAGIIGVGSPYVIDLSVGVVPHFTTSSQITSLWSTNGIAHVVKHGTTAANSQMYALPLSAHNTYAPQTLQRIITPAINTPNCSEYKRVIVSYQNRLGAGEFALTPEPFTLFYRIKGIRDNTGEWTSIKKDGDISGTTGSSRIQFMLEFGTIGWFGMPARIFGLTILYDDTDTVMDSHYQPSMTQSNAINKRFAWRFAVAFGGLVPALRIQLFDAVRGDLLVDEATDETYGVWEKSVDDGDSWSAYDTADKINETTYIRYTPASLGDTIKVRAVLTQQV